MLEALTEAVHGVDADEADFLVLALQRFIGEPAEVVLVELVVWFAAGVDSFGVTVARPVGFHRGVFGGEENVGLGRVIDEQRISAQGIEQALVEHGARHAIVRQRQGDLHICTL